MVSPEEEALRPVRAALEDRGYAIHRVPDLQSALNVLASVPVRATMTHMATTHPDAPEAVRILRQAYPDVPHLILVDPAAEADALSRVRPGGPQIIRALPDDEGKWLAPLEGALAARERARRRDRLRGSIP